MFALSETTTAVGAPIVLILLGLLIYLSVKKGL